MICLLEDNPPLAEGGAHPGLGAGASGVGHAVPVVDLDGEV